MKPVEREHRLEELIARWEPQSGDVWRVDGATSHRMHVSDCRLVEVPLTCRTLVFDPPWDAADPHVPLGEFESKLVFGDGRRLASIVRRFGGDVAWQFIWDCQCCRVVTNRPFQRYKLCLWYGNVIKYRWRGQRLNSCPEKPRGKKLADLYARPITVEHRAALHPHAKPLEWMRCLIGNCAEGDVFDPYLGSGVTILAADAAGRACIGCEKDTRYAALVLQQTHDAGMRVSRC